MTHYAGLDVSMNTTFICILNEKGKVVKELEAISTPESIDSFLPATGLKIEGVSLESGCLTHFLKKGFNKMAIKWLEGNLTEWQQF